MLEVDYVAEDLAGVDRGKVEELHRFEGRASVGAHRYPKKVRYGNTTPGDASTAKIQVVFDYGDHDDDVPTPTPSQTWPVRQDPFSQYRAGFELRTYRLCQRVLVFHDFTELGGPKLVQSVDLTYDADPHLTRLRKVELSGYVWQSATSDYQKQTLPPVELTYSLPTRAPRILELDAASLADFDPETLGRTSQWVDLDGEGLSGLLTRTGEGMVYKPNRAGGVFGGATPVRTEPTLGALEHAQILNVDGSGIPTLATFEGPTAGTFTREGGEWNGFRSFLTLPNVDWRGAQVRLLDLNGDGRDDVFVVTKDSYVWYPSLGRDGFGPPRSFPRRDDWEYGPSVAFHGDRHGVVTMADMTGDGQADLVLVTKSGVKYWPGLGNGRFGAMVTMGGAPWLDRPEDFDPSRVRLGDLDGSGPADLLYFDADGVRIYWNQAGNRFAAEPTRVLSVPTHRGMQRIGVVDVFGRGTSQIVWADDRVGSAPLRAADVVGSVKPWLLTAVTNHQGGQTLITYAPSTKFYLADKAAGTPWAVPLPFPVQVVERVDVFDAVRGHRFVSLYTYHHGAFDPDEREFRGFGRVDTTDTDWHAAYEGQGDFYNLPAPTNNERPQPPVLTKTWYHLGIARYDAKLTAAYEKEYWSPSTNRLPGPVFEGVAGLVETKEALRALRGQMLRSEVYGLDGDTNDGVPVSVSETRMRVRREQAPRGGVGATAQWAVMFVHAEEALSCQYEKNASDPRISQSLTLAVDTYGVVTKSATIGYGRGSGDTEQQARHIAVGEVDVVHVTSSVDALRLAVPISERVWELRSTTSTPSGFFRPDAILTDFNAATAVAYETAFSSGTQKKRLGWTKHWYYDSANLPSSLSYGTVDAKALPYESQAQAFTTGLFSAVYGSDVTGSNMTAAGYVDAGSDGYWTKSGRAVMDSGAAARFYLPLTFKDALDRDAATVTYDSYKIATLTVTDILGNVSTADIDYRMLTPWQMTDANDNRSQVAFDALGRVTKMAVLGKSGGSDGDTLSDPTVKFTYELGRWDSDAKPNRVKVEARETHGGTSPVWQTSYSYYDGLGGVAMVKVQAEPDGATARWVGTGRTVVNNKGAVIKQYEPYFSTNTEYEDEDDLVATGVTPIMTYDALGRLKRVDLPDGTWSRTSFTPWLSEAWDANDTVGDTGNLWYATNNAFASGTPEKRAAGLAMAHAGTKTVTHFDALGRPYKVVADLGGSSTITTKTVMDIEGQVLVAKDGKGRDALQYTYAVDGQCVKEIALDAGTSRSLARVTGALAYAWDARGHRVRPEYDDAERVLRVYVKLGAGSEWLSTRVLYGEGETTPKVKNLRGRAVLVFDGAGAVETSEYDFKGNPKTWKRTLATTYTTEPDWTAVASSATISAAVTAAGSGLESESWSKSFVFDALNRVTSATMPDASEIKPSYNEASLLTKVEVRIRGATAWTTFVDDIDYDAKGRRTRIDYGNTTYTEYTYDPLSQRLTRLTTTRSGDSKKLQDLRYWYDAVGNIVELQDDAHQDVYFNNSVVSPTQKYEYDAIYRLKKAEGREQQQLPSSPVQRDDRDMPLQALPHAGTNACNNYVEEWVYDVVGNITSFAHSVPGDSTKDWTRNYQYGANNGSGVGDDGTNRLYKTSLTSSTWTSAYPHDENGNITAMPHLAEMAYTHRNQMRWADLGGGGDAYYTYAAGGERVLKRIVTAGGLIKERFYLGGWELYRERDGSGKKFERETLHVMDDARRVAMVETKTWEGYSNITDVEERRRWEYDNHLGSACVECDGSGALISYEEYHAYGTPAYRAVKSGCEVPEKRYRYTGKERDDETGFQENHWRYYVPWLGRWTGADPVRGVGSAYEYCDSRPINLVDPNGLDGDVSPPSNGLTVSMPRANPYQDQIDEYNEFAQQAYDAYRLHGDEAQLREAKQWMLDAAGLESAGKQALDAKRAQVVKNRAIAFRGLEPKKPTVLPGGLKAMQVKPSQMPVGTQVATDVGGTIARAVNESVESAGNQVIKHGHKAEIALLVVAAGAGIAAIGLAIAGAGTVGAGTGVVSAEVVGGGAGAGKVVLEKAAPNARKAADFLNRRKQEFSQVQDLVSKAPDRAPVLNMAKDKVPAVNEAQVAIAKIPNPEQVFKPMECHACAGKIVDALKAAGVKGEVLNISAGRDYIVNDLVSKTTPITQTGKHTAVRVGNLIFDNYFPKGVDAETYLKSLFAHGGVTIRKEGF